MALDLVDFRWFVTVVDEGTFGRAAELLGVSQPSLSRRIAAMEKQLGVPLFSRERRQIELTHAGRALAREARGVLAEAQLAIDIARGAARGVSGHLRIAYRSTYRYRMLPRALRRLHDRDPDALVTVVDATMSEMFSLVRSREVDVALAIALGLPDDLASDVLRHSPVVAALPEDHPLARRARLELTDLKAETFIEVTATAVTDYPSVMRAVCTQAGFEPRIAITVDSADLLVACVAAGVGVALIYGDNDIPIEGVRYFPLSADTTRVQFFASYRAENDNPLLRPFLRDLHEVAMPALMVPRLSARRG